MAGHQPGFFVRFFVHLADLKVAPKSIYHYVPWDTFTPFCQQIKKIPRDIGHPQACHAAGVRTESLKKQARECYFISLEAIWKR
jgi:hypothetical protein